jgi:AraC-like DNA-binding protein
MKRDDLWRSLSDRLGLSIFTPGRRAGQGHDAGILVRSSKFPRSGRMDVLTDVLRSVRLRSEVDGRLELTAPWGIEFGTGGMRNPYFHVVSRGSCWLEVEGDPAQVPLAGGDFVLLPRGGRSTLRDRPEIHAVPIDEVIVASGRDHEDCSINRALRYGGGGAPATLISGGFAFEDGGAAPLAEVLPPLIHVRGDAGEPVPWLAATLQFLVAESASALPGSETVRGRLADILFVQAIRAHVAADPGQSAGWLKALADPQVGKALRLIHDRPGDPWTVESLADRVAMSRSAFAERFRGLVGIPPLRYLTRWRMHKAAQMLRGGASVAEVAYTVGYETESSFGKVFKRYTGTAPGEYRGAAGRRGRAVGPARSD